MKIQQFQLTSTSQLDSLIPPSTINPQWILVFGDKSFFTQPAFATRLEEKFPNCHITGCTTSGEIMGDKTYSQTCTLTLIEFAETEVKTATTHLTSMEDSLAAGVRLIQQLPKENLNAIMVFGTGVNINGSALIKGMQSIPGYEKPISGGLAGDNGEFKRTWTLGPAGVSDEQVVAIGFYGNAIEFTYGTFAGWEAFGPTRKITRHEQNILYELDNEPALAIYKKYLGSYADSLPGSGLLFPFEMFSHKKESCGIFRTILGIDEEQQSLILAGDIEPDGYMRLMHASIDKLVTGAEQAATNARATDSPSTSDRLAILVSCVGRKLVMGDRVDEEVEAVVNILGKQTWISGFYSNGEIAEGKLLDECKLHNQTMTITWIREC